MPSRTTTPRRRPTVLRALSALALVGGLAGCRPSSDVDVATGQALIELGDAVNDLRRESSILQQELDSLRIQVARQDTLLRQMANLAGIR
jgi:hypothetical protein